MYPPQLQPVRTAAEEHSLWRNLSEDAFRNSMFELIKVSGRVPCDTKVYTSQDWPNQQHSHGDAHGRALSFDAEQRLADDLAFIAVPEKTAKTVSAVAVEEEYDPRGLIFKLAANQGVASQTRVAFSEIFKLLELCTLKSLLYEALFT